MVIVLRYGHCLAGHLGQIGHSGGHCVDSNAPSYVDSDSLAPQQTISGETKDGKIRLSVFLICWCWILFKGTEFLHYPRCSEWGFTQHP